MVRWCSALLFLTLFAGCAALPLPLPTSPVAPEALVDLGELQQLENSIVAQVQETVQTITTRADHDLGARTRDLYETAFLVASCAFIGMLMIALAAPAFPKAWLNTTLALLGVAMVAAPMVYLLAKRGVLG